MKRLLDMILLLSVICGYISFILPEANASDGVSSYSIVSNDADRHINLSRLDENIRLARVKARRNARIYSINGIPGICSKNIIVLTDIDIREIITASRQGVRAKVHSRHAQVRAGPLHN